MPTRSSSEMSRRSFLAAIARLVAGGALSGLIVPRAGRILPPARPQSQTARAEWLSLGRIASLSPGVPKPFLVAPAPTGARSDAESSVVYAVTHDGQDVRVVSNLCTHNGCRIHWNPDRGVFLCPCHSASFSADGDVLSGPHARPLAPYQARVQDGEIQIRPVA
jgi:menaquinol-cytochrome c reductase iron-sulfur subunit